MGGDELSVLCIGGPLAFYCRIFMALGGSWLPYSRACFGHLHFISPRGVERTRQIASPNLDLVQSILAHASLERSWKTCGVISRQATLFSSLVGGQNT
eukprot:6289981-Amphidinium_carterae.1